MSKIAVSLKLDVTKIDKELLYKGNKGTYLGATIFLNLDEPDQYGNHGMITQDISQEARNAGQKGAILGNGKIFWSDSGQPSGNTGQLNKPQSAYTVSGEEEDSVPF